MTDSCVPDWLDVEIDKVPGAWMITWWLPYQTVTLRLKVQHLSCMDVDEFIAEVQVENDGEFQEIRGFTNCVYAIANPEECDDAWDDLPEIWTNEFKALLQIWARLCLVCELAKVSDAGWPAP